MATWNPPHLNRALGALSLGLLLFVAGCVDDESSSGSAPGSATIDNRVTGSVGDGPIVGARIRVLSNNGTLLMETESSDTADYDVVIRTQGRNYPLTVLADRGIDLVTNDRPDFRLESAIIRPNQKSVTNLNPYSTLIFGAARKRSGGLSDANVETVRDQLLSRYSFGLDSSLISDPTTTPIDNGNIHLIVKTSETLGEMIRRTRDAMISSGSNISGDTVVAALAADLADGWIDGKGPAGADPRIAAVANVASAAVMVQAMANRLHVNGADATQAMDNAIKTVRPDAPSSSTTAQVRIPESAIEQTIRALHAAQVVSSDARIEETIAVLAGIAPDSLPADIAPLLPAGIDSALETATYSAATASDSQLSTVNYVAGGSGSGQDSDDAGDTSSDDGSGGSGSSGSDGNTAPTISGTPDPTATVGIEWSFQPQADDADGDKLSFSVSNKPAWLKFDESTGRLWGTPSSANVGTHLHIVISVSDGTDSTSLEPFDITVSEPVLGSATVSWTPPTEREDGSSLDSIGHYTVYYGLGPDKLDQALKVDSDKTSHKIEELTEGTWYFAVTATCPTGLESKKSDVASKTIS
jgi:hypothetical protein